MLNTLTKAAFQTTFINPMKPVLKSSTPVIDIWPYVAELVKNGLVENYTYENNLVEQVYRNADNSFDHVLLPTSSENIFTVIIIDLVNKTIFGHFYLNLDEAYDIK